MAQHFTIAELVLRYPHLAQGLTEAEKESLQHEKGESPSQESSALQELSEMAVTDGELGADTSPLLPPVDTEC